MLSRLSKIAAALSVLVGAGALTDANAQTASNYPNQQIRFIITHPAGGLPDTVARIFGRRMEQRLGQSIVVENRAGANGALAVNGMVSSPADGYTFVVTDGAIWSVNPLINPQLSYQIKDLRPVTLLASAPLFLAVHPKVPANTLDEFIAFVRANPGKMNYGSSGVGSNHHLSMVAMTHALKLEATHVPFKGTGESVPALLGGHVDALFSAYPSLIGANEAKTVKMLAANGAKRSTLAPELPSIAEKIPGYDYAVIIGIYARAETPDAIVNRIAAEAAEIAKEPEIIQRLTVLGVEAIGGGPAVFAAALQGETKRVGDLIQETGLKLR
ncbi:MAG: tripartite tricarboxylate transporter substrate binding protein [Beijerinckiaceae bacterium]|nr:tripartite tricarboxylate transporter substrate binding protein [Beijerinckiaceae bacterium]